MSMSIAINVAQKEVPISQLASAISPLFTETKEILEGHLKEIYFPKNNDDRDAKISDIAALRLSYLALIADYPNYSPFMVSQLAILGKSWWHNTVTLGSMWIGGALCSAGLGSICYLGFAQDDESTEVDKIGFATLAAAVNVMAVVISFWATGFSPHNASNAFNNQQDMLLSMEEIYKNLAHKLIELFYSPNQHIAKSLADKIPIARIQNQIAQSIGDRADRIVKPLKEAIQYIKSMETAHPVWPENIEFKYLILQIKRDASTSH